MAEEDASAAGAVGGERACAPGDAQQGGKTNGGKSRGIRGRGIRWTTKMKEAFLDHLASTCQVKEAAEVIGVSATSVYALRRRNAAFAAAWGEALALGYEMLETRLVGYVLAGGGRQAPVPAVGDAVGSVNVELALTLLSNHRNAMLGKPINSARQPLVATREESNALILKKLRMIETRNAAPAPTVPDSCGQSQP